MAAPIDPAEQPNKNNEGCFFELMRFYLFILSLFLYISTTIPGLMGCMCLISAIDLFRLHAWALKAVGSVDWAPPANVQHM